jgi:hypothetical protein
MSGTVQARFFFIFSLMLTPLADPEEKFTEGTKLD